MNLQLTTSTLSRHAPFHFGGLGEFRLGKPGGDGMAFDPDGDIGRPGTGMATRVFIVEDEMFVAWHLEDMVQSLDLQVGGIAASGEEALTKVAELEPDLVLMDINLGAGIDGVETARRIGAMRPIPVIFISAYNDAGTTERVRNAVPGAAMLQKPVTIEALRRAIARSLEVPNA